MFTVGIAHLHVPLLPLLGSLPYEVDSMKEQTRMLAFCGQLAPKEKGGKVLALQVSSFPKLINQETYCFCGRNWDLGAGMFQESLPFKKEN